MTSVASSAASVLRHSDLSTLLQTVRLETRFKYAAKV